MSCQHGTFATVASNQKYEKSNINCTGLCFKGHKTDGLLPTSRLSTHNLPTSGPFGISSFSPSIHSPNPSQLQSSPLLFGGQELCIFAWRTDISAGFCSKSCCNLAGSFNSSCRQPKLFAHPLFSMPNNSVKRLPIPIANTHYAVRAKSEGPRAGNSF